MPASGQAPEIGGCQKSLYRFGSQLHPANQDRGAHNRVTAISSKRIIDIWQDCKLPVLEDYKVG